MLKRYKSAREWLDAMKEHTCSIKKLYPADYVGDLYDEALDEYHEDEMEYRTAYVCECGTTFCIEMKELHSTMNLLTDNQRVVLESCLKSSKGREVLAANLNLRGS